MPHSRMNTAMLSRFLSHPVSGFALVAALAAPPFAAAATFDLDGRTLAFSEIIYGATAFSIPSPPPPGAPVENQTETTEFLSLGEVEATPVANVFLNAPSGFSRFVEPFNGSTGAFASSRMTPDGDGDIGVSGFVNTVGSLTARANYNYSVTNVAPSAVNLNIDYEVPEIELSLIGVESQVGQESTLTTTPGATLQYALARAALIFEITDANGAILNAGSVYDFGALLSKRTASIPDPFGFTFDASRDLQGVVAAGVSETVAITGDVLGAFDVARLSYGPISGTAGLPAVPLGGSIEFDFLLETTVQAPGPLAIENGGEARVGDPFTISPDGSMFRLRLADAPIAPVPGPPSLALALGALFSWAALRWFRGRRQSGLVVPQ